MSIYTQQEIIDKIKAVDADIAVAQKVSEYELKTGQGDQRARRQDLSKLIELREYWVTKHNQSVNSDSGIMYGDFKR